MMIRRLKTIRDQSGAAAIEFALAVPVLVVIMWGIFQIGMIFEAQAGMQHALGEGARYATLCLNPTVTGCTIPSDTAIQAKITSHKFGLARGTWSTPTIDNTNLAASGYKVITVQYSQQVNFIVARRTVTLSKSKRVYVSA